MGLTDVLLGVAVAAIALPTVISVTNRHTESIQEQVAAQQLKAVAEAADGFIRNNFRGIYNDFDVTGTRRFLTIADLRTEGYLPASFADTNAFGQDQAVLLRRVAENTGACSALPATGDCAALIEAVVVTTGGDPVDPARAARIATMAGHRGGTIVDGGTARGSYGGWCTDLSHFDATTATTCSTSDLRPSESNALSDPAFASSYAAPAAGGLAAALYYNGTELTSDYLARVDTGNPEDNTMRADIIFTDLVADTNGIFDPPVAVTYDHAALLDELERGPGTTCAANQVVARNGADDGWECIDQGVRHALMVDDNAVVAKPDCSGTPVIYTAVASFADSAAGNLVAATQTWAEDAGSSGWTVHMRVRIETGWVEPPANYGKILAMTGCTA